MNADGSGESPLTSTPLRHESWPAWSPDGIKLAFFGYDGTRHSIYFTNPDGSGETRFPVDDARDAEWSPDGTRIAFSHELPLGAWRIFVANLDGTG